MENGKPGPEETDAEDSAAVSKKRRGRDFLSQYQQLLKRSKNPTEAAASEENEEDTDDESPKKWRRLFKGIFTKLVTAPDGKANSEAHGFNADAWYGWQSTVTSEAKPQETTVPQQEAGGIGYEIGSDSVEPEGQPAEAATEVSPEAAIPVAPEVDDSELPKNLPEPEISPEAPTEQLLPELPQQRVEQSAVTPQPLEREVVIERGVGGGLPLLLVGAEYLGRKRADKRIRQEFTQKTDRLETSTKAIDQDRQQLEQLVRQNKEQLETLKQERGLSEQKAAPQPVERRMQPPETQPEAVERVESKRVLESVVDAAEHNVPVERVFERSHEVKDDASSVTPSATSVGAIMAAQAAQSTTLQKQVGTVSVPTTQTSNLQVVDDPVVAADMYKQAMRSGFFSALILIIIGLLGYLVVK